MTDTGEFAFAPRGFGFGVDIVDGKREGGVFIMFWKRRGDGKGKCVNNRIGYDRYRKAGR